MARKISVEIVGSSESVERAFSNASRSATGFSRSVSTAEKDASRSFRGIAAGSGIFSSLGRSLAFASSGFLGVAAVSSAVRSAVEGAADLEKANASLGVVLKRNNAESGVTIAQLDKWAKAQQNLGVSQTEALTGLERTVVLTGSASKGMLAYRMGLELSRAENISLDGALRIAGKAIQGQTTSLTRYGIILPKTTNAQKIFNAFQARFAGQALANTDAFDRLRAAYQNVATDVGTALLPVFEKYANSLSDWLSKTHNQKKVTVDVSKVIHGLVTVLRDASGVVKIVDHVTGSFVNTLKLLAAFKLASLVTGWIGSLQDLAAEWGIVGGAATAAGAAEGAALVGGGAAAGAGGAAAVAARGAGRSSIFDLLAGAGAAAAAGRGTSKVVDRINQYTGATEKAGAASEAAATKTSLLARAAGGLSTLIASGFVAFGGGNRNIGTRHTFTDSSGTIWEQWLLNGKVFAQVPIGIDAAVLQADISRLARHPVPPALIPRGFGLGRSGLPSAGTAPSSTGPFGTARPIQTLPTFSLTFAEQMSQAQAALTRTQADDVAAARRVVARIKRLIDEGRLKGAALIQALQAEASALSTIWSAEDAAAQKRAAAAAAAKQRIQQQIENSIDPLRLEVALSRAEALGRPLVPYLKALRAAAEKALESGKLSLAQQKEAYDQITSLNQQIKDAATAAVLTFTAPARLQLALARDQALGLSQTKDLEKLRRLILKFIKTHKHNIAALIDAYNQLAQVNEQLGSSAQSALGLFKELNTRQIADRVKGLTAAQRAQLRAVLSQIGPGGTVPGSGTGAFGYAIGDNGRPIVIHHTTKLDGKVIERSTTRHQQRRRRRNPTSRRGPNAATA